MLLQINKASCLVAEFQQSIGGVSRLSTTFDTWKVVCCGCNCITCPKGCHETLFVDPATSSSHLNNQDISDKTSIALFMSGPSRLKKSPQSGKALACLT